MTGSLDKNVEFLISRQLREWELAQVNYAALKAIRIRKISYSNTDVFLQYNPGRIISSTAKVDTQSISARPCFLCNANRPTQQESIQYDDFLILVNPYPIFPWHLTIPTVTHQPQFIKGNFKEMLKLAKDLQRFTLIYNGPQCGASAPDHFHFQAVGKGQMPVEFDFSQGSNIQLQGIRDGVEIYSWNNYPGKMITFRGADILAVEQLFYLLLSKLEEIFQSNGEPMLNILAGFEHDYWTVHLIPRNKHRPRQFFEKGDNQILISPGSIDLGGILILVREEDFVKITSDDVTDIYQQVCVDDTLIQLLVKKLI